MIQPQQISKLVDFGRRHHPINLYVTLGHHSEIVVDQFHQKKKKLNKKYNHIDPSLKLCLTWERKK